MNGLDTKRKGKPEARITECIIRRVSNDSLLNSLKQKNERIPAKAEDLEQ